MKVFIWLYYFQLIPMHVKMKWICLSFVYRSTLE